MRGTTCGTSPAMSPGGSGVVVQANPLLNSGVGSWTDLDYVQSCVYIDLPEKHCILFPGNAGHRSRWYGFDEQLRPRTWQSLRRRHGTECDRLRASLVALRSRAVLPRRHWPPGAEPDAIHAVQPERPFIRFSSVVANPLEGPISIRRPGSSMSAPTRRMHRYPGTPASDSRVSDQLIDGFPCGGRPSRRTRSTWTRTETGTSV